MDQILLYTNHIPRTTSIHNTFIENYMPEANGDYVKVYLYLAKCIQYQETGLSISTLADRMDNTEKDVIRALQYWEKRKLLQMDREPQTGTITGIHMLLPESPAPAHLHTATDTTGYQDTPADRQAAFADSVPAAPAAGQTVSHNDTDGRQTAFADNVPAGQTKGSIISAYCAAPMQENFTNNLAMTHPEAAVTSFISAPLAGTPAVQPASHPESKVVPITGNHREISVSSAMLQELASNDEFVWTCHVIESYLDRPMKPDETQLISYLYGTLHFSKDLLLYLYEYCISLGKTNNNYIQAVALSWDEQGVTTPEEAEKVSTAYNSAYNAVSKSLALGRALATVEKKCVDRWQHTWHMDLSVILEACNRTILKIHKADFKYIEGILDRWQKNGVHTLQDVEKADLAYAHNKENSHQTAKNQPQNKSRNQFQNFQQRNASAQEVDDLERRLLLR